MAGASVYCCDTSSLIHAWKRAYPPKSFKSFWQRVDELIAAGRLISSIEVYAELQRLDDDLFAWAKERKAAFLEIEDDVQEMMVEVMGKYPRLVDTVKGKSSADPFVIALARTGEPGRVVLHQEQGGSLQRPKIGIVCDAEKIPHMNLLDLIEQEGWEF